MRTKLVNQASDIVHQMNELELNDVIRSVKLRREYLAREAASRIIKGDEVEFFSARTGTVRGTVTKVNRKTVVVYQAGRGSWKVPAELLKPVKAA